MSTKLPIHYDVHDIQKRPLLDTAVSAKVTGVTYVYTKLL